jgi:hypothetical protein
MPNGMETSGNARERDEFQVRHPVTTFCSSTIFSENRIPLFRIMLSNFLFEHDRFRKTGFHFSGSCSLAFCLRMIFSKNRMPLFRIMLSARRAQAASLK